MSRRLRSRGDRGATAVEFALVVPLALVLISFTMAAGLRVLWGAAAQHNVREAVRYGTVTDRFGQPYPDDGAIGERARSNILGAAQVGIRRCKAQIDAATGSPQTVCTTGDNVPRPGDELTVTVRTTVPGVSSLGMLGAIGLDFLTEVTETATGRYE